MNQSHELRNKDGDIINKSKDIATCLASILTISGKHMASKIPKSNLDALNYVNCNITNSLFLRNISWNEIYDLISGLANKQLVQT